MSNVVNVSIHTNMQAAQKASGLVDPLLAISITFPYSSHER